jgi:hypothetical protein
MRFAPLNGPLSHRIEGNAARIRDPHITHIIETMDEARRTRRRPRGTQRRVNSRRLIRLKASLTIDGPATRGQNPTKNRGSLVFPGRQMHLQNAAKPGASRRDLEPRSRGIEIGPASDIESISRDFEASPRSVSRRARPTRRCGSACLPSRPQSPK